MKATAAALLSIILLTVAIDQSAKIGECRQGEQRVCASSLLISQNNKAP